MLRLPRLLLLAPLAALALLFAPAGAQAQTCTVTEMTNFGTTTLDVVPNGTWTATGRVSYNCRRATPFTSVRVCAYIKAVDETSEDQNSDYTFYVTQAGSTGSDRSQLAWQMQENFGRRYARDGGGSVSTGGILMYFGNSPGSASGTNINGTNTLTLTYLDRQQQDRVRPGSYSRSYRLISKYLFNPGSATCEGGLANPSGTVSTNFTVGASVLKTCQLDNGPTLPEMDFGKVGSVAAAQAAAKSIRATAPIEVRCTYKTDYKLTAGNGQNFAGGTRRMRKGSDVLAYGLFQPGCATPWDSTTPIAGVGTVVKSTNTHLVCGVLTTPVAIAPTDGTYTDTVVVNLEF